MKLKCIQNPHINIKVPNQPHPLPRTCMVSAQPEGCLSAVACHRNRIINLGDSETYEYKCKMIFTFISMCLMEYAKQIQSEP